MTHTSHRIQCKLNAVSADMVAHRLRAQGNHGAPWVVEHSNFWQSNLASSIPTNHAPVMAFSSPPALYVLAVALLASAVVHTTLDCISTEDEAWYSYHSATRGLLRSFPIVRVACLLHPEIAVHSAWRDVPGNDGFTLTPPCVDRLLASHIVHEERNVTVGDILGASQRCSAK